MHTQTFLAESLVATFNSPIFLFLFLPLFLAVFHLAARPAKLWIAIFSSLVFYAWASFVYLPVMIV